MAKGRGRRGRRSGGKGPTRKSGTIKSGGLKGRSFLRGQGGLFAGSTKGVGSSSKRGYGSARRTTRGARGRVAGRNVGARTYTKGNRTATVFKLQGGRASARVPNNSYHVRNVVGSRNNRYSRPGVPVGGRNVRYVSRFHATTRTATIGKRFGNRGSIPYAPTITAGRAHSRAVLSAAARQGRLPSRGYIVAYRP